VRLGGAAVGWRPPATYWATTVIRAVDTLDGREIAAREIDRHVGDLITLR
jgi:hypothetical protein